MRKKALITGGTGFIGRNLISHLERSSFDVWIKSRNPEQYKEEFFFRSTNLCSSLEEVPEVDLVINLCGENLANKRWTVNQKRKIYQSRIDQTNELVEWMATSEVRPKAFISGSAIGFYGDRKDEIITESSQAGKNEFQVKLCQKWEQAAQKAEELGIRSCYIRTGVVLGDDGALPKMLTPFKFGVGGKLGTGNQWFSWIHIQDQVRGIMHLVNNEALSGVFNLTSPNPVTNKQLTDDIANKLSKKAPFTVPGFALKLAVGQFSDLLLTGQKVIPQALQDSGFEFKFPTLTEALNDLVNSR
ncbi:TIGR01777 family protein [Kangiella sp. HZ709]|nr:TIGR01777 family protein [Kangiella sp. HZ709]